MKTLQNNFTTPEQSERLLELGVSADSADCFIDLRTGTIYHCQDRTYSEIVNNYDELGLKRDEFFPCWSVGRLIEIWHKTNRQQCSVPLSLVITHYRGADTIIEYLDKLHKEGVDFSKLEE
jgi:hypothetical protein